MFEALLTLCLSADPASCRTERLGPVETRAACIETAAEAVAAARAAAAEEPQDWPCVPAGTTPAFTLTEIAPGVLVHKGAHAESDATNRGDIANLGAVIGERSVAVIDTGGSAAVARDFLAAIRERTDLPVSHAILTHMHPDHALGASVFAAEGAEIVAHRRLARALATRAPGYLERNAELIGPAFEGTTVTLPNRQVAERFEIDLGGRVLELEAHPTAHTDNDLTVFDTATGTWFLGDLLFMGHLPVVDGSLLGWIELADALAARGADRVVPGHGPVAVPWPDSAAPLRAYLATLAAETRKAIAEGMAIGPASRRIAPAGTGGWLLVPAFAARNALAAYAELEWE